MQPKITIVTSIVSFLPSILAHAGSIAAYMGHIVLYLLITNRWLACRSSLRWLLGTHAESNNFKSSTCKYYISQAKTILQLMFYFALLWAWVITLLLMIGWRVILSEVGCSAMHHISSYDQCVAAGLSGLHAGHCLSAVQCTTCGVLY